LQQARSDGRVAPSRAINQRGTVFRLRFHIFGPTIERDAQAVFVAAQSPTSPGHQSLAVAGSRTTAPRRIHSLRRSVNTINSSCDLRLCKLILPICSDMIESICPESDSRLLSPPGSATAKFLAGRSNPVNLLDGKGRTPLAFAVKACWDSY